MYLLDSLLLLGVHLKLRFKDWLEIALIIIDLLDTLRGWLF